MTSIMGGQPVRDQEPHFLLRYCKQPQHTYERTRTLSHLFLTHTHIFAQPDLFYLSHTKMTITGLSKSFIAMHVI